jgi:hypothetical protein
MRIVDTKGPTIDEMRRFRPLRTHAFPVYHGLVDALLRAEAHPDLIVAHTLAVASGYACSTTRTVADVMAHIGLDECHCRMVAQMVDPMFICSVAHLIQSKDGRVVLLAYRGTEPRNSMNWLTNFDTYPKRIRVPTPRSAAMAMVHGGFYRNTMSTRFRVMEALKCATKGHSVMKEGEARAPMEALYITGHSLGGAMAALLTVLMMAEKALYEDVLSVLKGVYTFGQPMIGDPTLAAACQGDPWLSRNVIRFIHGGDPIPSLPPTSVDPYEHFGQEMRWIKDRWYYAPSPTHQLGHPIYLVEALIAAVFRQFRRLRSVPFRYSIADHLPQNYIDTLSPAGVESEFGD